MRFRVLFASVAILLALSCTTETDLYVTETAPIIENYKDFASTFSQQFADGLPSDLATADRGAIDSLETDIVSIETDFSKVQLPYKFAAGDQLESAKEARDDFFQTTSHVKNFLNQFRFAVESFNSLNEYYGKVQKSFGAADSRKPISADQAKSAFLTVQGHQVTLQDHHRRVVKRIENCAKESKAIVESHGAFSSLARDVYGIDLPPIGAIDTTKALAAVEKWKQDHIADFLAIDTAETFQEVYPALELP